MKDNRIPPYGFRYDDARARNALPVPADQYGNPGPGGVYEHTDVFIPNPPQGADYATVELKYQPTSWEYIQFLYLGNDLPPGAFLADEIPSRHFELVDEDLGRADLDDLAGHLVARLGFGLTVFTLFEELGEFFRQYFFALDREEMPFNRAERSWVYRAAKGVDNTVASGSWWPLTRHCHSAFLSS